MAVVRGCGRSSPRLLRGRGKLRLSAVVHRGLMDDVFPLPRGLLQAPDARVPMSEVAVRAVRDAPNGSRVRSVRKHLKRDVVVDMRRPPGLIDAGVRRLVVVEPIGLGHSALKDLALQLGAALEKGLLSDLSPLGDERDGHLPELLVGDRLGVIASGLRLLEDQVTVSGGEALADELHIPAELDESGGVELRLSAALRVAE
mmetsp:Transcript_12456/g.24731  ORF Transcript_12456/g.24731 Transcript_12456/m.24731 type:complete len:201 (-) Transcript_12456:760-1362(-)